MSVKTFLDTNVLIYGWNDQEPGKQTRALALLESGNAVISWQVIQEFCNVALHKFQPAMPVPELERYVLHYLEPLCRVTPSRSLWSEALRIHAQTQYAFYDALIVASAMAAGAAILYSEDLQHGRTFGNMRIENPFFDA